jgi:NDP-sugar pyrophosphorylase family protein
VRPLTNLRPKPALPVRGLPLVAYNLALLARHGVREVILNTHHLPAHLCAAAERWRPESVALRFSHEPELLGTGGGIRRAAAFLRESDPCLVLGGDMLLDVDLGALVAGHRARGDAVTLLLRDDPRAASFGTIGVARDGRVRRIGRRFDLGGETQSGVYAWANVLSPRAFDAMPERDAFEHLSDWWAPMLAAGRDDVRGVVVSSDDCVWEPVGTPAEYLDANLHPPRLSYLDADRVAAAAGTRFEGDVVIGAGAELGPGVRLRRAVVWDGERVPAGLDRHDGVFAGGAFHPCTASPAEGA